MHVFKFSFAIISLMLSSSATSQRVVNETTSGIERSTPFGGIVWEKTTSDGMPGVTILSSVYATWDSVETVDLPAGSGLGIIREKKLKACQSKGVMQLGTVRQAYWSNCLIDLDDDGRFDRVTYRDIGFSKKLEPPISYTRGTVQLSGTGTIASKSVIIFSGSTTQELRLSYREFVNDMARPAFTEDLVVPLGAVFPQTVAVKNIRLTVLSIDGLGLKFRLD